MFVLVGFQCEREQNMDSCTHTHSQICPAPRCQEGIPSARLPEGTLHLILSPDMPWVSSHSLDWWTKISQYFWSDVKIIWGHFWKSEPFGHACPCSMLHALGKHWCSLNYCITTYLSLIHKCQVSENVRGFWKNIVWDLSKGNVLWVSW